MSKRKRPVGEELDKFIERWYSLDHSGKVSLAYEYDISYETARHIVSDSGKARSRENQKVRMPITVPEILARKPAVHLDFVCFDIETSNLDADFSILLTACIKPYGQEPVVFRADEYPKWLTNRQDDKRITEDIANELRRHAIVVGHYSQRFDVPFLRAKMDKHRLTPLPPMFGIDTWRIAKNSYKISSRRLENLGTYFDLGDKHPVSGKLWMEAAYGGSREAMDEIVAHNIQDVKLLEALTCLSFHHLRSIPKL